MNTCSVCFEYITNNSCVLGCTHVYHKDCIDAWLQKEGNCPLCRHQFWPKTPSALTNDQNSMVDSENTEFSDQYVEYGIEIENLPDTEYAEQEADFVKSIYNMRLRGDFIPKCDMKAAKQALKRLGKQIQISVKKFPIYA